MAVSSFWKPRFLLARILLVFLFAAILFLSPAGGIFPDTTALQEGKVVAAETASNPAPKFHLRFEGTTTDEYGDVPSQTPQGIDYVPDGIEGKALKKPVGMSNYILEYDASQNIIPSQGTIEFWMRPTQRTREGTYFREDGGQDPGNSIHIAQARGDVSDAMIFGFLGTRSEWALNRYWVGGWHQVVFTWRYYTGPTDGMVETKVYIDGYYKPLGDRFSGVPPAPASVFYVGCKQLYAGACSDRAYADIDELKIYDVALTEEEIRPKYIELFPVEYYAEETVFKFDGKGQQQTTIYFEVEIENIREEDLPPLSGTFRCQVEDQAEAETLVNIDEGDTATLGVQFVASATHDREYDLNCTFIPTGAPQETKGRYNRTIKLFVIDGDPRPSRDDTLYLKPIVSIDASTEPTGTMTTYDLGSSYESTYIESVGDVQVRKAEGYGIGPVPADAYADTKDASIGEISNVGSYRQSGPAGKTLGACTPYRGPSWNEDVVDFENPNGAHQPGGDFAWVSGSHKVGNATYRDFFPNVVIPKPPGARIVRMEVRLDAECKDDNPQATTQCYFYVHLSNDGTNWTSGGPHASVLANTAVTKTPSWDVTGWSLDQLKNVRVRIFAHVSNADEVRLDWVAVKVYYGYYSRFAYKFGITNENNPHLVVVTYPDDGQRIMGIDLSSRSHSPALPERWGPDGFYQIQTGVSTGGDDYPNTNEFKQHTIYFWPRDKTYMITFVNWLGASEPGTHGAAASRIDVYEIEPDAQTGGWFPSTEVDDGGRMLGLWWEQAEFYDNFGAVNESLEEYYKAALNAMDYLHFTGQNLLVYNIWQYAPPHYPSRAEHNIYNYWTLVRYHPYPADWFELLLKVAEVNGINVIPSLTINNIPSLDLLEELDPGTGYTVANIEQKVLATIDDLLDQYGDYRAFKGISLNIWSNTINKRLAAQWRYINPLLDEINAKIQQKGQQVGRDLKLIVSCWVNPDPDDWYESPDRPQLVYDTYDGGLIGDFGIGLDLNALKGQDGGIRTERVLRFSAFRERLKDGQTPDDPDYASRSREFFLDYASSYEPFLKAGNNAAAIFNGYFEDRVIKKKVDGWVKVGIDLLPVFDGGLERNYHGGAITPGHKYFMENYMLVMTYLDPVQIGNGGMTVGTVGHEQQIQEFAKAFRALPAEGFKTIADAPDVQIRELEDPNDYYFYVVNKRGSEVGVQLQFNTTTLSFSVTDLVTGGGINPYAGPYGAATIDVTIGPYELRSYRIDDPSIHLVFLDKDEDGTPDIADPDDDNDGFTDEQESYVGTNSLDARSHPLDIDGDGVISVTGDVINYVGRIGARPGDDEWWQRLDLDMSGDITVTEDVWMFVGRIGEAVG